MSVPSLELGPSPPVPQARVPPTPGPKWGGTHSPVCEGVGSSNSDDWRESLVFCLLCGADGLLRPPPSLSKAGFWTDTLFEDGVNGFSSTSDICFMKCEQSFNILIILPKLPAKENLFYGEINGVTGCSLKRLLKRIFLFQK